ncbi:MAG: alpha/beta hydrolase [Cyanobacteria bacterium TGS_CYA1]|nr:alpha/beta hydrolase [Cyanobacteria bacterium TGS_CYA1]
MKLSYKLKSSEKTKKAPVILIHGTGSHGEMWEAQTRLLNDHGHPCLTIDLRGHGETFEPGEKADINTHILDVIETLEASEIPMPAIFVGHSLGAIISLKIAQSHPHYTKTIFLAALPGRVLPAVAHSFRWFLAKPYELLRGGHLHDALPFRGKALLNTHYNSLHEIVNNFESIDLTSEIFEIDCPAHLSAGRFDPVAPYMYMKKVQKNIRNSTLTIFDLGGHNFMDYYTHSFNRWILDNLPKDSIEP